MSYPKEIYVIRHCDKDEIGDGCSNLGYERALLLAGLTGSCEHKIDTCNNVCTGTFDPDRPGYFPKLLGPDVVPILIAPLSKTNYQAKNKKTTYTGSNRCCLILNPLAYYYKTQINMNNEIFSDTQPKDVAKYILQNPDIFAGKVIIIAYEHNAIPDIVNTLGVTPKLSKWPDKASDRYDLVFKITFDGEPSLSIFSQQLLPGDSADILFSTIEC